MNNTEKDSVAHPGLRDRHDDETFMGRSPAAAVRARGGRLAMTYLCGPFPPSQITDTLGAIGVTKPSGLFEPLAPHDRVIELEDEE
jgi:hypothetical protein